MRDRLSAEPAAGTGGALRCSGVKGLALIRIPASTTIPHRELEMGLSLEERSHHRRVAVVRCGTDP